MIDYLQHCMYHDCKLCFKKTGETTEFQQQIIHLMTHLIYSIILLTTWLLILIRITFYIQKSNSNCNKKYHSKCSFSSLLYKYLSDVMNYLCSCHLKIIFLLKFFFKCYWYLMHTSQFLQIVQSCCHSIRITQRRMTKNCCHHSTEWSIHISLSQVQKYDSWSCISSFTLL